MNTIDQECCPKFEVEKWDRKTFDWANKPFIKESMATFCHIPFPPSIGKKITRMHTAALDQGAAIPDKTDVLILFRDPSAFKSEIFYAVTKNVEGAENTAISGRFVARVFDGKYNKVPMFIKEMEKYLKEDGKVAKDYYIHYAYCPKCAQEFGNNYMIIFALI